MTRNEILEMVQRAPVRISFTKKDGSERVIETLPFDQIPIREDKPVSNDSEKSYNESYLRVYSRLDEGWRTIIVDSVKEVDYA